MDPQHTARIALACLDLTSLNDADTEADVGSLCERATSRFGPVAAVCVWPRFVALARRSLPAEIAVAAVANFPDGSADVDRAVRETHAIVDAGGDEVDVVLPFGALAAGNERSVARLLAAVRAACTGRRLKVILETGVLADGHAIDRAATLALAAGADLLKTSTGRSAVGATPAAVDRMLAAIAADASAAARVGVKVAGGVRTVADAAGYIAQVAAVLGPQALTPQRFRIGASGLLADIEAVLGASGAAGRPDAGAAY